jgi:hypothetical protein
MAKTANVLAVFTYHSGNVYKAALTPTMYCLCNAAACSTPVLLEVWKSMNLSWSMVGGSIDPAQKAFADLLRCLFHWTPPTKRPTA